MSASERHSLDWFFLLRPTLLFPVCTVFLAGYRFGDAHFFLYDWIVFVPAAIAMGGGVYVLNEAFDVDSDRANKKLHYLQDGTFSAHTAKIYGTILGIIGLLGLWWVAKTSILWIGAGFAITGLLYNLPPFRWKDRPTAGILVAVLGGGITFWSGLLLSGSDITKLINGVPYLFAFGAVSLLTQLLDADGDAASGKSTFAVRYGIKKTGRTAWWGTVVALLLSIWLKDWYLASASAITVLLGFRLMGHSDAAWGAFTARVAILILSILIGIQFPVYLLTIIVYYLFARWYYRMRFQINYPSLTGTNW